MDINPVYTLDFLGKDVHSNIHAFSQSPFEESRKMHQDILEEHLVSLQDVGKELYKMRIIQLNKQLKRRNLSFEDVLDIKEDIADEVYNLQNIDKMSFIDIMNSNPRLFL